MTPQVDYADYEVTFRLIDGKSVKPVPALPNPMRVGKTVRYSSPDGALHIEFENDSPFEMNVISDGQVATIVRAGNFKCHCSLTPPGQTTAIGWPADAGSGGDHNVEP